MYGLLRNTRCLQSFPEKELKTAYKKKVCNTSDRTGGDDSKSKEINEAYSQVLGNKEKREMYDTYGTADPKKGIPRLQETFTSDGFQASI